MYSTADMLRSHYRQQVCNGTQMLHQAQTHYAPCPPIESSYSFFAPCYMKSMVRPSLTMKETSLLDEPGVHVN